MLQALNTGHDGSLCTLHANSPSDALRRLETLVLFGAVTLPLVAIRQQITANVDAVVAVGSRRRAAGRAGDRRGRGRCRRPVHPGAVRARRWRAGGRGGAVSCTPACRRRSVDAARPTGEERRAASRWPCRWSGGACAPRRARKRRRDRARSVARAARELPAAVRVPLQRALDRVEITSTPEDAASTWGACVAAAAIVAGALSPAFVVGGAGRRGRRAGGRLPGRGGSGRPAARGRHARGARDRGGRAAGRGVGGRGGHPGGGLVVGGGARAAPGGGPHRARAHLRGLVGHLGARAAPTRRAGRRGSASPSRRTSAVGRPTPSTGSRRRCGTGSTRWPRPGPCRARRGCRRWWSAPRRSGTSPSRPSSTRGAVDVLVTTGVGRVCLVVGLGLEALAAWWIRSIVASEA